MLSLNQVMLAGNLTRDPETRYTTSGQSICAFGLAVNRRYTTASGEQREDVCFIDIEAWGRQGELCQQYLHKGRNVLVEGRLRYDQWEDRQTGQKRSTLKVNASRVHFIDWDDNTGGGGGGNRGGQSQGGGGWQQQARAPRSGGGWQQQQPPQQQSGGGWQQPRAPQGAPQGAPPPQRPQQPPPPPFPEGSGDNDTAEPFDIGDDDSIDDIPF